MFAEARLEIGRMLRPAVPADAVVKRGKTWHAYVVLNGEVHDRVIQLGASPGPGMESIVKGVEVGEVVVRNVRDGKNPQVIDGLRVETAAPAAGSAAN